MFSESRTIHEKKIYKLDNLNSKDRVKRPKPTCKFLPSLCFCSGYRAVIFELPKYHIYKSRR